MFDITDKTDALAQAKDGGGGLEYHSDELRADKEVVMVAVKNDPYYGMALGYASDELQTDPEILALIDD